MNWGLVSSRVDFIYLFLSRASHLEEQYFSGMEQSLASHYPLNAGRQSDGLSGMNTRSGASCPSSASEQSDESRGATTLSLEATNRGMSLRPIITVGKYPASLVLE